MASLPNESDWSFDDIKGKHPDRAEALKSAGQPNELVEALGSALKFEIDTGNVRWGWEHAEDAENDCRAVIQFQASPRLFDWFFNARTGYRAHFRASVGSGLAFNNLIINAIRDCVDSSVMEPIACRELSYEFDDIGHVQISKDDLLKSFHPDLSKMWLCGKLILLEGGIKPIAMGYGGPKLILNADECWEALYLGAEPIWLDCKGAFLGKAGAYQVKDPICRAEKLQADGEA